MGDTKPIRAFLALELPREIRDLVEGIKERLRPVVGGVRWTRAEGMHLTLKFFGDILPEDVDRISAVVRKHSRDIPPLKLSLDTLGGFPGLSRPRVLWLGVGGEIDRLANMQEAIEKDLAACGFPAEGRAFTAHLTLGRSRSRGGVSGAASLPDMVGDLSGHLFEAAEMVLFKSDLRPAGPLYTALARFPFGGADEAGDC